MNRKRVACMDECSRVIVAHLQDKLRKKLRQGSLSSLADAGLLQNPPTTPGRLLLVKRLKDELWEAPYARSFMPEVRKVLRALEAMNGEYERSGGTALEKVL